MNQNPAFLGQVRLAQTTPAVSPGGEWWSHHIENTKAYLVAGMGGDYEGALAALAELWSAVLVWQKLTRSKTAGLLMAEHTALAKLLIDCSSQKQGAACSGVAGAALMRNVDTCRALFPVNPAGFADLFGQHVQITGAYIGDYVKGDAVAFAADYQNALQNSVALGAWTDAAFFGA